MKPLLIISLFLLVLTSCKDTIVNSNPKVVTENGTQITTDSESVTKNSDVQPIPGESYTIDQVSTWTGMFNNADEDVEEMMYVDEGFWWTKNNKITVVITKNTDVSIVGYSVVAGNKRPFKGSRTDVYIGENTEPDYFQITVEEPGDNKYDGQFTFQLDENHLDGVWESYDKSIEITKRMYELKPNEFKYNANNELDESTYFVDWNNSKTKYEEVNYGDDEADAEIEAFSEFASATEAIYKINASNTLLAKTDVENLKKSDLRILRNAIFARHGYSFKTRVLRVFFDAQDWYVPISTDVKDKLTLLEKKNIDLLLKYEQNAEEYYDYFGRG